MLYTEKCDKAKECFEKALKICSSIIGPDHANVTASLHNIGLVYENIGEYEKAKELHEKALETREKTLGPHHVDVAASLRNLFCTKR